MDSRKQAYPVKSYKTIRAKEIEWLWYPYIAYGKITIIQGDPGEGKSTVAINLASNISNGLELPFTKSKIKPQSVIYQNCEDGKDDTIVPRLVACGADLDKVLYIDESNIPIELGDERLEQVVEQTKARVLILDPVQAYWGANTDMNRAASIRPIMNYLAQIAQRHRCAIIMIGHMNKASGKGLYRGLGSIDIAAAARSVLLVSKLKNQANVRVLAHVKNNLAPLGESILFMADEKSHINWLRRSRITAEQILDESYDNNKVDRAISIIRECLESGECAANVIMQKCEEHNIAKRTVNEAKAILKIESVKRKNGWYWILNAEGTDTD